MRPHSVKLLFLNDDDYHKETTLAGFVQWNNYNKKKVLLQRETKQNVQKKECECNDDYDILSLHRIKCRNMRADLVSRIKSKIMSEQT